MLRGDKFYYQRCSYEKKFPALSHFLPFFPEFSPPLSSPFFLFRNGGSEVKKFALARKINTIDIGFKSGLSLSTSVLYIGVLIGVMSDLNHSVKKKESDIICNTFRRCRSKQTSKQPQNFCVVAKIASGVFRQLYLHLETTLSVNLHARSL